MLKVQLEFVDFHKQTDDCGVECLAMEGQLALMDAGRHALSLEGLCSCCRWLPAACV